MNNAPNLDAMERSELLAFWRKHKEGANYRALFPEGGKGSKNATRKLAAYAINKATAMMLRTGGGIIVALQYERICDDIYATLEMGEW